MKKTAQPVMKKVYAQPSYAQDIQMNAVRKINSLLSSGTVSVTGPSQTRIMKQQQPAQPKTVFVQKGECYICDEHIGNNGTLVTEAFTTASNTKIPTKIGRIVGDAFMVIVSVDDVICKRCLTMFNQMDRLETDLDRVKSNILTLINKKYGINDNGNAGASSTNVVDIKPPPAKVQRLNTSVGTINANYTNRKTSNGGDAEDDTRKITTVPLLQPIQSQPVNQFAGGQRIVSVSASSDAIDGTIAGLYETAQQNNFGQTQLVRQVNQQAASTQRKPIKIYKCMSCDFKTTDIKLFQPHYDTCRQQNGYRCKLCKKLFTSVVALKAHNVEKHASEFTCSICSINYMNEATYKKHMETNHPDIKTIETSTAVASGQLYSCNICTFKTYEKGVFEAHSRKHVKVKPFKCRICSARFETRELAGVHAKTHCPDFFKCGTCSMTFTQKDLLVKHFETHKPQQQVGQKQQIVSQIQTSQLTQPTQIAVSQDLTTQKLLQDTIDEALRETGDAGPKINFYSCHICSLTFIQETYYKQHMETHKRESNKKTGSQAVAVTTSTVSNTHSLIRTDQRVANTPTTIIQTQTNTSISDNDLEIMFEKMHSDKAEIEGNANNTEGVVITSHESSTGGYTFNITMANQQDATANNIDVENKNKQEGNEGLTPVTIDMPQLDQSDDHQLELQQQQQQQQQPADQEQQTNSEQQHQEHLDNEQKLAQGVSVSMPSLDDDADGSQPSSSDQVPMDLDDIQNAAESGQIKFILNENGQLLQLDNHILTTDAEGNQILVQDSEQIQQLLQSVGVLQASDGEGGEQTFQMIQGENNQMILVQGDNNEAQLIDASMLNEDGQLVIQHHGDQLPEGMHVVNEDGVQVPVSIAFAQHLESAAVEHHQQQQEQHELQHQEGEHEIEQKSAHHQDQQQHTEEIEAEQAIAIKSEDTSSQDGDQQAATEADSGEWQ
ncbi:zinc finger protein 236-like isoform X3 [Sitodiplosis mosellana]|uniref:zinc finger protein 236-like isoform X3 n=1 Tax=Sitodiplosis mosellana TaxID=263140 RepID=UPI0024447D55|nr:zinc finger protein 236-like isoform X3 [Sitodiplosis mosellana]